MHQSMFPFTKMSSLEQNKCTIAISLNLVFVSDCYVIEYFILPVNTTLYYRNLGYLKLFPWGGGGGGGHLGIFVVGMCRPGLQIGTPF